MLAEEHVEDGLAIGDADLPVAVGHGDLVEIGKECEGGFVELGEGVHGCLLGIICARAGRNAKNNASGRGKGREIASEGGEFLEVLFLEMNCDSVSRMD